MTNTILYFDDFLLLFYPSLAVLRNDGIRSFYLHIRINVGKLWQEVIVGPDNRTAISSDKFLRVNLVGDYVGYTDIPSFDDFYLVVPRQVAFLIWYLHPIFQVSAWFSSKLWALFVTKIEVCHMIPAVLNRCWELDYLFTCLSYYKHRSPFFIRKPWYKISWLNINSLPRFGNKATNDRCCLKNLFSSTNFKVYDVSNLIIYAISLLIEGWSRSTSKSRKQFFHVDASWTSQVYTRWSWMQQNWCQLWGF